MSEITIPVWEKYNLTIEEAAPYFHIGENKLRHLINENPFEDFILNVGNRTLIKRRKFEAFIDRMGTI